MNRRAIFLDDDRHHDRRLLRDAHRKHAVTVHAFGLMNSVARAGQVQPG